MNWSASWKSRAPWVLAAVLALAAIAGWQDARETRRKFAGVPEELKALAVKVDELQEKDMDTIKSIVALALSAMPKDGRTPHVDAMVEAARMGVRLRPGSCLWNLFSVVKDCRDKGLATDEDWRLVRRLEADCLKGGE